MTKDEAIRLIAGIAAQWAENEEETFGRISPYDTDETLADKCRGSDYTVADVKRIRDAWIAIDVLSDIINAPRRLIVTDEAALESLITDIEGRWENARDDDNKPVADILHRTIEFLAGATVGTKDIPSADIANEIDETIENSCDDEVDVAAGIRID